MLPESSGVEVSIMSYRKMQLTLTCNKISEVISHAAVSHSEESESDESSVEYNDDIDEIDDENDNEDNDTENGENDKYVSTERFKGFPKKVIENNKLLIRGKSLKKLMSK